MNFLKKIFFSSTSKENKQSDLPKTQIFQDQIPPQVLTELFEKSAKYIAQASTPISDENKLIIYGVYKQATIGDCNTPKPSMLDFVGKSKWNAWNSFLGMSKSQAMKMYISNAVKFVPEIERKMQIDFEGNEGEGKQMSTKKVSSPTGQGTSGLKMVEQKDYSSSYSHPYFRLIEKGLSIEKKEMSRELLLQRNNNPKCFALHFAIDKERVDLVRQFLQLLTVDQILGMEDEEGTGIKEYAELIENEQIMGMIEQKLKSV